MQKNFWTGGIPNTFKLVCLNCPHSATIQLFIRQSCLYYILKVGFYLQKKNTYLHYNDQSVTAALGNKWTP